MNGAWLAVYTLWQREMARFFRQPSRIAGAIGTPLIFWLFLGSGLQGSFHRAQQAVEASHGLLKIP